MRKTHMLALRAIAIAALAGAVFLPSPAKAWVSFGFVAPPIVVAPPVAPYPYPYYPPAYYPPAGPGYYPPPPPGYAQPQQYAPPPAQSPAPELAQQQRPYGTTCYAGVYTCGAPGQAPVGSGCSCPGLGAPSYGVVQ